MKKILILAIFLTILLLVNHHPVFADLAACGCYCGKVLPPPCSDEACKQACGWQEGGSSDQSEKSSRRWERYQDELAQSVRAGELARQGDASYSAGRYQEALDLYMQAQNTWNRWQGEGLGQRIKNCRSMLLVNDADAAIVQDDYERAAGLLREAMSINPKFANNWKEKFEQCSADALTKKGMNLIDQEKYKEAESLLTKAVKTYPKSSWAYNNLGRAMLGQNRYREAEAFFLQATQLDPTYAAPFLHLGEALQGQKRYSEAEAAYRKALSFKPNDPEVYDDLAFVLANQNRDVEAEAEYREAIKLGSSDTSLHYNLGVVLRNQGRLSEAEEEYRQAVKDTPDNPDAYLGLGRVLDQQKRYSDSEKVYSEALKRAPENTDLLFGFGRALHKQDRHSEAEAAFRQAIKVNPSDSSFHYGLGRSLENQKRFSEAESAYREAVKLAPKDASNYEKLGDALKYQNRLDEAEAVYKNALNIEPDNERAKAGLEELSSVKQAQVAQEHGKGALNLPNDEMSLEARKGFDTAGSANPTSLTVDTRNIALEVVPEKIANNPKFKAFQAEEDGLIKQREALNTELAEIRKQKETDVQNKGKHEVEEAKKKQQISDVTSKVGVVETKKKDFIVSFKED